MRESNKKNRSNKTSLHMRHERVENFFASVFFLLWSSESIWQWYRFVYMQIRIDVWDGREWHGNSNNLMRDYHVNSHWQRRWEPPTRCCSEKFEKSFVKSHESLPSEEFQRYIKSMHANEDGWAIETQQTIKEESHSEREKKFSWKTKFQFYLHQHHQWLSVAGCLSRLLLLPLNSVGKILVKRWKFAKFQRKASLYFPWIFCVFVFWPFPFCDFISLAPIVELWSKFD